MRAKQLRTWVWPPPPVACRLWLIILVATLYSLLVYLFAGEVIARMPGWSSEFGLVNGIILGVFVGVRIRAALDRWADGQKVWTDVLIHSRNLALKVGHLVRAGEADRRLFADLVEAFARCLAARLRGISARPDLPPGESVPPETPHVPAYLAGRLLALTVRWHANGKLDLPGLWAMETNIRALMDAAGHCERIALAPVPASFHALLRHGLLLSILLAPWHMIHNLGLWAVAVQAVVIYFLFGIELTAEEIENPFGTEADDLPLDGYCDTVRRDVADILNAAEPKPARPASPTTAAVSGAIPTVTNDETTP